MALETLLIKVKTAISNRFDSSSSSVPPKLLITKNLLNKPSFNSKRNVAVLSFEIAGLMSKLLHLWHSLSDSTILRIRNDAVTLEGVRKIISNHDSFLLSLACAEFVETLRLAANSVTRLTHRCQDPNLKSFNKAFVDFADSGRDPNGWALSGPKETEAKLIRKLERYVTLTATLHREMEELSVLENGFRKALAFTHHREGNNHNNNNNNNNTNDAFLIGKEQKIYELQQKIFWQRQEVKDLKEKSLWSRNFDGVVLLLVRFCFTALARIKLVFGIGCHSVMHCLSRTLSASATVYPSDHHNTTESLERFEVEEKKEGCLRSGFFESNSKLLKPPSTTLGAAALALHYANLIIVLEKMIKTPHLIGLDARDDLYGMLPSSIRLGLRARLKGVGFCASDPVLAGEWRDALGRILGWLSPLAHNMIKWQSERSFEQHNLVPKTNVLLLQTLFFANKDKTEAAITELLVGLNYIWRFEREMTAKALFESANFNGLLNMQKHS